MKAIYDEVARRVAAGESVATATIIRTRGSTPREVGAQMLVSPTELVGTVGGGCGEADARLAALAAIGDGSARIVEADLTEEIAYDTRGVCGGVMEMLIEPWRDVEAARQLASALAGGDNDRVAIATLIERVGGGVASRHFIVPASGAAIAVDSGAVDPEFVQTVRAVLVEGRSRTVRLDAEAESEREVFVDVRIPAPTLLVCGAGHIAVPLVAIGKILGFRVVVIDDRAEFANRERFPDADEVIADDFAGALARQRLGPDSYVVLITRGHSHDVDCLLPIIDLPLGYVGMIGSRRRVWAVYKLLSHFGVTADKLRRIHAPIGIDLAAETPAEIALAIAAEVVGVRNGGNVPTLSDAVRDRYVRLIEQGAELG